jgi:hypothetical protein
MQGSVGGQLAFAAEVSVNQIFDAFGLLIPNGAKQPLGESQRIPSIVRRMSAGPLGYPVNCR